MRKNGEGERGGVGGCSTTTLVLLLLHLRRLAKQPSPVERDGQLVHAPARVRHGRGEGLGGSRIDGSPEPRARVDRGLVAASMLLT